MKHKAMLALLVVLSSVVAADCVYGGGDIHTPISINVPDIKSKEAWQQIAQALQKYGDTYKNIEGTIRIHIQIDNYGVGSAMPLPKICGETLQQAADRIAESAANLYAGGGGGGTYFDPFIGGSNPNAGCVAGNCDRWGVVGKIGKV